MVERRVDGQIQQNWEFQTRRLTGVHCRMQIYSAQWRGICYWKKRVGQDQVPKVLGVRIIGRKDQGTTWWATMGGVSGWHVV